MKSLKSLLLIQHTVSHRDFKSGDIDLICTIISDSHDDESLIARIEIVAEKFSPSNKRGYFFVYGLLGHVRCGFSVI